MKFLKYFPNAHHHSPSALLIRFVGWICSIAHPPSTHSNRIMQKKRSGTIHWFVPPASHCSEHVVGPATLQPPHCLPASWEAPTPTWKGKGPRQHPAAGHLDPSTTSQSTQQQRQHHLTFTQRWDHDQDELLQSNCQAAHPNPHPPAQHRAPPHVPRQGWCCSSKGKLGFNTQVSPSIS